MPKITVLKSGLATSIQDEARKGMAFYGVPVSGFMDQSSGKLANLLVGNIEGNPCLEMSYTSAHVLFDGPTKIAVTGADMQFSINDRSIVLNQSYDVDKGDVFKGKGAVSGVRSYLAIQGDWELRKQFDSVSTYTLAKLGGLDGGLLKKGDSFHVKTNKLDWIAEIMIPQKKTVFDNLIKISNGPEYHLLNQKIRMLDFVIGEQSNRMAVLLKGAAVRINMPNDLKSCVVFPGVIQCTPSGSLIVVLRDGQTTGGYPRVGIIERSQLDRFNQIRIGSKIKFT